MCTVSGCTVSLSPAAKSLKSLFQHPFESNLVSLSIEVLTFTICWCHLTVLPVACQLDRHSPDASMHQRTRHLGIPGNRLFLTLFPFSDRFPPLEWYSYLAISFANRAGHAARACKLLRDGYSPELVPLSCIKQANNIPDGQATGNLRRANLCASLKQLKFHTHPAFLRLEPHKC